MAKPPPSTDDSLLSLQRKMGAAIMRRLTPEWDMQADEATSQEYVKPNDRLTSFERLEIYNRQYWFRLIDSMYDDFPALQAVLGDKAFSEMVVAYLEENPPDSFTLRNLGYRLPEFLQSNSKFGCDLVWQTAQFEWAQINAFDAEELPPLSQEYIRETLPAELKINLQPYVSLLELDYGLDDFDIALKRSVRERSEACVEHVYHARKKRAPRKCKKIYLGVHRLGGEIYYKRLDKGAFDLLIQLRNGCDLTTALSALLSDDDDVEALSAHVQQWFAEFMNLGWFCSRAS